MYTEVVPPKLETRVSTFYGHSVTTQELQQAAAAIDSITRWLKFLAR